jgi:hypothetical protein
MCGKILHTLQFGIIMCVKKVFTSVHKQINKSESINNYLPGSNRKYGKKLQVQKNTVLRMLAPRLAGPNRMLQGSQIPAACSKAPRSQPQPSTTTNTYVSLWVVVVHRRPCQAQAEGDWAARLWRCSRSDMARNRFGRLACGGVDQSSFSITRRPWHRRVGALVSGGGGWNKEDGQNGRKWIGNIHLDLENLQEAPFSWFCPSIFTQNN